MNRSKLKYFVLLIAFVCGFVACGRKDYKVLSRSEMEAVLYDLQLADALFQNNLDKFSTKEQKDALINSILMKHNITQVDLDSSLVWYSDNVELYVRVNDSVLATLRRDRAVVDEEYQAEAILRAARNPSQMRRFFNLTNSQPTYSFELDSSLLRGYQNFNLKFKTLGMQALMYADVAVYFTYKDTVVNYSMPILVDAAYTIPSPHIADTLKKISGYIHINISNNSYPKVLLYDIKYTKDTIIVVKDSIVVANDTIIAKLDSLKVNNDTITP